MHRGADPDQLPSDIQMDASIESNEQCTTAEPEKPLRIRVGEQVFWTSKSTLIHGSSFFESMLSSRWAPSTVEDEVIFVDADPGLFKHVLGYLRHGTYPIFWSRGHFDLGLYAALLQEARYFGIIELEEWISRKAYLNTIHTEYVVTEVAGLPSAFDLNTPATVGEDVDVHVSWRPTRQYRCPRNIPIHHGSPNRCGMACERAKTDGQDVYDVEHRMHTVIIGRKTTFTC